MNLKFTRTLAALLLLSGASRAAAQGTAFTYQGQLTVTGAPASGVFDIRGSLYTTNTGGTPVTTLDTNLAVGVSNGMFMTLFDFGSNVFDGPSYWLQVDVRTNGTGASFTTLSPRQELTPTPYAIFAEGADAAGLSGTLPVGSLSGTYGNPITFDNPGDSFSGNGAGLTNVNAVTLNGLAPGNFWQVGGNVGVSTSSNFIGNTDNQYFDIKANGVRALRLRLWTDGLGIYNNAPNVIGGSSVNLTTPNVVGATIAGGGGNGTNGDAYVNEVYADFGTIGGGANNTAGSLSTTVSGGFGNIATNLYAMVGGGLSNAASGPGSFIGGGGFDGYIADGAGNNASGAASVVGGGLKNGDSAIYGTIGGGFQNTAASTTGGFFSGGATVAGGTGNKAATDQTTVGGGYLNTASGLFATVPGGVYNTAGGTGTFAAGQYAQTTNNGTFIWSDGSQNPFAGAGYDDGFNVLASGGVFFFDGAEGVHIDYLNQNSGSIQYGLRFGAGSSGEGMASRRAAGGNQYGLDFYTSSANRMSIANGGFVGINTTNPTQRLEVNGNFIQIDGANAGDGSGPIDAYIGGNGSGSDVQVGSMNSNITSVAFYNWGDGTWMHISCSAITINGGADLAEPFQISTAREKIPEGSVVVIDADHPGQLKMSTQPYDTSVAGVLSGANGINPGIQMRQQGALEDGKNVALTGRVYVLADASNGAIRPGDLLTTSSRPGHAMKVTDHARAQGAILGKAMTTLNEGQGMVLALVTLQ